MNKLFKKMKITLNRFTALPFLLCIAICIFYMNVIMITGNKTTTVKINTYAATSFAPVSANHKQSKPAINQGLNERYAQHLQAIRVGCGDICTHEQLGTPSLFFDYIEKPDLQCEALCSNAAIDAGSLEPHSPQEIPDFMKPLFTYDGRIPIVPYPTFFDQQYLGATASQPVWTESAVNVMREQASSGNLHGNYGQSETKWLIEGLEHTAVRGKNVLVIGSENPWVEACVLNAGAAHVTTLEYGKIVSQHPQISTLTPDDMRRDYGIKYKEYFDAIVTFSSVEHAGLGRYGDALNPWGDRQAIARAWCMAKKGARLLIGVMYNHNSDSIEFNAHRVYSAFTLSHLLANWKQVWRAPAGGQLVHVLEKP
jgi:hypothetical protein